MDRPIQTGQALYRLDVWYTDWTDATTDWTGAIQTGRMVYRLDRRHADWADSMQTGILSAFNPEVAHANIVTILL